MDVPQDDEHVRVLALQAAPQVKDHAALAGEHAEPHHLGLRLDDSPEDPLGTEAQGSIGVEDGDLVALGLQRGRERQEAQGLRGLHEHLPGAEHHVEVVGGGSRGARAWARVTPG